MSVVSNQVNFESDQTCDAFSADDITSPDSGNSKAYSLFYKDYNDA